MVAQRALVAAFACAFSAQLYADIYTWTDAFGRINVSNVAPPADVHVTKVIREDPAATARAAAARNAARESEIRTLTERVAQLEQDASLARVAPAPMPYPVMPPAPPVPYSFAMAQPPVQPPADFSAPMTSTCSPFGFDCASVWPSVVYPAGAVVLRTRSGNHFRSIYKSHQMAARPSMHGAHPPRHG